MRYGERGAQVRELQQRLIAAGYPLPRYGADGVLGTETWDALQRYAGDSSLLWAPEVPPAVVEALMIEPVKVVDLTSKQTNPPADQSKWKVSNGKVVVRDAASVSGIMLHQTGVWYGVSSAQVAAAGGDRHAALHNRGLNIACHAVAFDGKDAGLECGHGVATAPLKWYCYQANTANSESLGLEVEGVYPGLVTPGCTMPSERVINAARDAVRYMVEQGRREGMPLRYIWAHRQSSAMRRSDPGEALWKRVALEYAVAVLGLETQPSRTWGDGRPIPVEWQPGGVGPF
jgi:peptidoglycan hydrolase-like protein with peptidoglycan-binding domain